MKYTSRQKAVIENIVTIHETGKLNNKSYGTVTNVRGDPGGLTYGKHQVTINGGGLYLMLNRYCQAPGARHAAEISKWLAPIRAKNTAVVAQPALRDLLQRAGDDPIMAAVQDKYFDDQYWLPAVRFCDARELDLALALAVVYDSTIHGSLHRVNKLLPAGLDDRQWILQYVEARRRWFLNHSITILRRCTYRMDTFRTLYDANNFDLNPPVFAHGRRADVGIDPGTGVKMTPLPPIPVGITSQRILDLGDKGPDVVELQEILLRLGYRIGRADGDFGRNTEKAVKAFQKLYNVTADGIVGPTTWRLLDQVDD